MSAATDAAQLAFSFEAGASASAAPYPSDEEILGINDGAPGSSATGAAWRSQADGFPDDGSEARAFVGHGLSPDNVGAGREGASAPEENIPSGAKAPAKTPDELSELTLRPPSAVAPPEWLAPLLADPRAGNEAREMWQRATQLGRMDEAYFSGDARAHDGLAASLYSDDPRAFAAMLSAGARLLAARDPAVAQALLPVLSARSAAPDSAPPAPIVEQPAQALRPQTVGASGQAHAPVPPDVAERHADQFIAFQRVANDALESRVRETIDQTLSTALPAHLPAGARRRIAEEIFHELHTTLAADRSLAEHAATLLRGPATLGRAPDKTAQALRPQTAGASGQAGVPVPPSSEQIVNLIFSRARQALPGVARRVVNDWTAALVATNQEKFRKQNTAASRVELAGSGPALRPRAWSPRDVDYSKLSDDEILSL